MDFLRSVLSKNVHHGLAVKLIHRDCDNGMPGGETRIVGLVLLRLVRLFAEQPTPKASALIFRLTCPVFLVSRFVLGIALDVSGRYLGFSRSRTAAAATERESKAATIISVMEFP